MILTKATEVQDTFTVYAVPRSDYERKKAEEENDFFPFKYVIQKAAPWGEDGAVEVMKVSCVAQVPYGIDLLEKTVETLRKAKVDAQNEADEKIEKYDHALSQLLQITHQEPAIEVA